MAIFLHFSTNLAVGQHYECFGFDSVRHMNVNYALNCKDIMQLLFLRALSAISLFSLLSLDSDRLQWTSLITGILCGCVEIILLQVRYCTLLVLERMFDRMGDAVAPLLPSVLPFLSELLEGSFRWRLLVLTDSVNVLGSLYLYYFIFGNILITIL